MKPDDPRLATVECALARVQYEHGHTGTDIAEMWITAQVSALLNVRDWRRTNPQALQEYGEATPEETARRIIARLLDAGWRPADTECLDLDRPESLIDPTT